MYNYIGDDMKKLFKEHSTYLLILALAEAILSVVATLSFVYSDSLNYSDSILYNAMGVEKLLESLYSSTWWALILFTLAFITIMAITSIKFKKLDYLFISILGWIQMMILAINITKPVVDILITLLVFVPIIILNVIAYKTEYTKLNKVEEKKETKKKTNKKTSKN